jgi:hypothetical protein
MDHQLAGNLHASVDFTHRYNDFGSTGYILGTQPGTAAFPLSNLWVGPFNYTDPNTGITAPYFVACAGCTIPSGNSITSTSLQYQTYNGASVTLTKRLSNRWQGNISYTWNDYRQYEPPGSFSTTGTTAGNPTGVSFVNGFTNNTPDYTVKAYASVELPWYGLLAALNYNLVEGAVRTESINGPNGGASFADCPPGTPTAQCTAPAISYGTLAFEPAGTSRYPATNLLDVSVSKNFDFGRQKLTVTFNCFNLLNINSVTSFQSSDLSNNGLNGSFNTFNSITGIVPPRVFRIDLRYAF